MRDNFHIVGLAAALLVGFTNNAAAYLPGYRTRTIESGNGEYLLVLLTPESEREYRHDYDPTTDGPLAEEDILAWRESLARQKQIEGHYLQSGLYRNDGSATLLWPTEYVSVSKEIYVANDGIHLIVAFLDWDQLNVSDRGNALEFYARGQQLASYQEADLLDGYLPRSMLSGLTGASRVVCEDITFNEDAGQLAITTNHRDAFRFDVTTGELIDRSSPWSIVIALLLTAVALVAWLIWRGVFRARGRETLIAGASPTPTQVAQRQP